MRKAPLSGSLYRLIYCSRDIIAQMVPDAVTPDGLEREIRAILATARARNAAADVTGALLSTTSGFAQVLEGPRDAVERTFERIGADPRHTNVTVLSFTPTERRSFPDWSMGFCSQASHGAPDPLALFLADASFAGPRATTGSDVLRLLETVVRREEEWIVA
ncbi:MAG TPA: BLUF domain-containing protein [Rhodopila sp.]